MLCDGSTTISAWKPVILSLMFVIEVLFDTFHMRKIPAWESEINDKKLMFIELPGTLSIGPSHVGLLIKSSG